MPSIQVLNRQRKKQLDHRALQSFAVAALDAVARVPENKPLPEEILIVFVSDSRIAEIHRDFMAVDGATDVITFQHGEVFIRVETADRQSKEMETSFDHEVRLYILHGLLHLAGYDDLTESGFREMSEKQEHLLHLLQTSNASSNATSPHRSQIRTNL